MATPLARAAVAVRRATNARHTSDRSNKTSIVPSIPSRLSEATRYGLIFLSEAVAFEYLIEKQVVDVHHTCQAEVENPSYEPAFGDGDEPPDLVSRDDVEYETIPCNKGVTFKKKWTTAVTVTSTTNSDVKAGEEFDIMMHPDYLIQRLRHPLEADNSKLRCKGCQGKNRHTAGVCNNSLLANSNLTKNAFLELAYHWCLKIPVTQVAIMTGIERHTVSQFYKFFREAIMTHVLDDAEAMEVGGVGVTVEIDESKYGKRKYHRGHRIEGNWVFGGVERLWDPIKHRHYAGKAFAVGK